jgi:hypothetical protein
MKSWVYSIVIVSNDPVLSKFCSVVSYYHRFDRRTQLPNGNHVYRFSFDDEGKIKSIAYTSKLTFYNEIENDKHVIALNIIKFIHNRKEAIKCFKRSLNVNI